MKRFTMIMIAAILAIGSMVGQVLITVTDGTNPIDGASVTVSGTTETTVSGVATFNGLTDGTGIEVNVTADGYIDASGTVDISAGVGAATIVMEAAISDVLVKVRDINTYDRVWGTGGEVEGADVTLTDGGSNTYNGLTGADGNITFTSVPFGDYTYTVTMDGYATTEASYTVNKWSYLGQLVFIDFPKASFAFDIRDITTYDRIWGTGGELEGALVTLTLGDETHQATSGVDGLAQFNFITYSDYSYTVTISGYENVTGDYAVDETSSLVNKQVFMTPGVAESFAMKLKDATESGEFFLPSGTIELVNVDDESVSFTASVVDLGMPGFPMYMVNFTDVPYGNYNGTAKADGFNDKTFTYEVNDGSNQPPTHIVNLDPIATGINDIVSSSVSVYPNPAEGVVTLSAEVKRVEIYNVSGSLVKTVNGPALTQLDISDLSNGLYVFIIHENNGKSSIVKVNKQ